MGANLVRTTGDMSKPTCRRIWSTRLILNSLLFSLLLLLAMRSYLTSGDILLYQNWGWPLAATHGRQVYSVYTPYYWTNFGYDPWGYTKVFLTWPVALGYSLGLTSASVERLFIVYCWAVSYCLSYFASRLFLSTLNRRDGSLASEAYSLLFVALMFVNPAAIQWEAGLLFPFMWGASLLAILVLLTIKATKVQSPISGVPIGIVLAIAAALDPRLFIWGAGLVVAIFCARSILSLKHVIPSIKVSLVAFLVSLPGVVLTAYAYLIANYSSVPLRTAGLSDVALLSANSSPSNVFELLGYWWSTITYAPPSLSGSNPGTLSTHGVPPYMLNIPGITSEVWIIALLLLPIFAFASLLSRKTFWKALPFATLALLSAFFSMGTQSPLGGAAVPGELAAGGLPIIGPIWQTTIGVPVYFVVITEACYVPMLMLSLSRFFQFVQTFQKKIRFQRRYEGSFFRMGLVFHYDPPTRTWVRISGAVLVIGLLLAMTFLGSWQFGTGSFYPAGQSPGSGPNLIPSVGALSPEDVPASDHNAYAYLMNTRVNGTIAWPSEGPYVYPWANRSTPGIDLNPPGVLAQPQGLPYLLQNRLLADVAPDLAEYGIEYLVVDNMSKSSLSYQFGLPLIVDVVRSLELSPHLQLVKNFANQTWVFKNLEPASMVSAGGISIANPADSTSRPISAAAFEDLGLNPTFVPPSFPGSTFNLTLGQPTHSISPKSVYVVTAQNLSETYSTNTIHGFASPLNSTPAYTITNCGEYAMPKPYQLWTISVWGPCFNVSIGIAVKGDGSLSISSSNDRTTISVNYLSALTTGNFKGIPVNTSASIGVKVSAEIRPAGSAQGSAQLNVVASNSSAFNIGSFGSPTSNFTPNESSTGLLSAQLPRLTALFTLRIFGTFEGTLDISNVSLGWSEAAPSLGTFSGASFAARNVSIIYPSSQLNAPLSVFVDSSGEGRLIACIVSSCTERAVTSSTYEWTQVDTSSDGPFLSLSFQGNLSIGGFLLTSGSFGASNYSLSNVVGDGYHGYSAAIRSSIPLTVSLDEEFVPAWTAILSNGREIHSLVGLGQTLFILPKGNYTVRIELSGLADMPYWTFAFAAYVYSMAILMVGEYRSHSRFRLVVKQLVQRLRLKKGGKVSQIRSRAGSR